MIKFIRIDHRLLHGQVVFSWSKSLQINRILVVNDEAANDEFKKMSLELSKPQGIKLNIFTVENTLTKISKIEALSENIMMIFGNTKDVRQFCESYSNVKEINYGGIKKKEGSKQFSNAIFLTENEIEDAKVLKSMGIKQFMQQVPTSKKEDLNTMI
ncbi:PTS sugar transporter subunit IIB [Enterococcus faecium]|uniref:PTS sugar transporter subunit IIB n=1 Tax=Enterococcus TaxID=1350 RepID=UPI0002A2F469|nr:PTS sugar transporter subunit IIB [Enterococcus faecium]EGP5049826.1 PTS sugar transporter subunit IIB [Enterococcus faecium]EGP5462300.1 PTS mannose/fructose/sorbose transporter subunit IIB [Enterococcus faecium]EGP5467975.1 PTS mannose/fructose/sorbose transporter subunit IIB [Enterococcus faecium]EGP5479010.1 PTS mannose/fructose/sorbose transporter subunit IIB [Enterococcus faecium]EGP5635833.1 PTS mannose/fructose/sorbose transporter subunit IIB [Enterococcus faecium]